MTRITAILVTLAAIALGLVIGTLNAAPVRLDLLWLQLDWPLGLVVLLAFTGGILAGLAICWLAQVLPLRLRLRRLQRAGNERGAPPGPTPGDE